jgi:prepilin-type N-terminal cleavage/methylation domain-containing protein
MKREKGFSLMEVVIVLALVTGLMIVVYTLIEETLHTAMFNESHNDLTIMTQRAVNQVYVELLQSATAYQDDTVGNEYRAALQIPATTPVMPNSLLPVFDTDPALNPDTGTGTDRRTGNSLLIVRSLSPLEGTNKPVLYDHDNNNATAETELPVDRYRFEYFFLSRNTNRNFSGAGWYLDLVRATSGEYADYFQLSTLTPAQLTRVTNQLLGYGIQRAWHPAQPLGNAFYDLNDARDGTFNPAIARPTIAITESKTMLPEMRGGRISGRMDYSVTFRPTFRTPYPIRHPVFAYAQADSAKPGFPSGFEVKVAGPIGFRKVFVRLALMSNYRATNYESQQGVVTTATRF